MGEQVNNAGGVADRLAAAGGGAIAVNGGSSVTSSGGTSAFSGKAVTAAGLTGVPGNAGNIRSVYGSAGHSVTGPVILASDYSTANDRAYLTVDVLRNRLAMKRLRVKTRYAFYEMKNLVRDFGISTPPALRGLNSALGWCASAVDSLADRLVFREFRGDVFDFNTIFAENCQEVLTSSAVLSALISACSFIRIYRGDDDEICMENMDGGEATGVIDPRTMLLKEGYCVLSRDTTGAPVLEAWFKPFETRYYERKKLVRTVKHSAPYPLLVPIIFRPDAKRPFGHSRISRACMSATEAAIRTIKRSEISAEFYSFPQKYITGLERGFEMEDKWQATMSSFLTLTVGEDGEKPSFGQFSQQSMEPHMQQLRMFASIFAGETGMTLDDMGFPSDNPSSQEAIKAAHENLRRRGKRAQATFGTGFKNAGYLAACLRDDFPYKRKALSLVTPIWEPLFEPDAAGLNLLGDGVIKINQAVPDFVTPQMLEDMTGLYKEGDA